MTLLDIRKQFIKESGRFDLVVDRQNYVDNGADFYIKAGQKFLDTLLDSPKDSAVYPIDASAGSYLFSIPGVRAIKNVYYENEENERSYLVKTTLAKLENNQFYNYAEGFYFDVKEGKPEYYANVVTRNAKDTSSNKPKEMAFVIFPKPEEDMQLVAEGLFYSDPLESDAATSYWSLVFPHTLVQSALYMMERFYRNTEGAQDHLTAIRQDVDGIDNDVVEEAIAGVDQMNDSFDVRKYKRRRDYGFTDRRIY